MRWASCSPSASSPPCSDRADDSASHAVVQQTSTAFVYVHKTGAAELRPPPTTPPSYTAPSFAAQTNRQTHRKVGTQSHGPFRGSRVAEPCEHPLSLISLRHIVASLLHRPRAPQWAHPPAGRGTGRQRM